MLAWGGVALYWNALLAFFFFSPFLTMPCSTKESLKKWEWVQSSLNPLYFDGEVEKQRINEQKLS